MIDNPNVPQYEMVAAAKEINAAIRDNPQPGQDMVLTTTWRSPAGADGTTFPTPRAVSVSMIYDEATNWRVHEFLIDNEPVDLTPKEPEQ